MNLLLAAGLFENPWIIVAIVIISAVSNWWNKRREAKQGPGLPSAQTPGVPSPPVVEPPDLEAALRRLLGQPEPVAPSPPPLLPPPQPVAAPAAYRRIREDDWVEQARIEIRDAVNQTAEPMPLALPHLVDARITADDFAPAASVPSSQPKPIPAALPARKPRPSARIARWHNARNARQAFIGSLIFAPPKSLQS